MARIVILIKYMPCYFISCTNRRCNSTPISLLHFSTYISVTKCVLFKRIAFETHINRYLIRLISHTCELKKR